MRIGHYNATMGYMDPSFVVEPYAEFESEEESEDHEEKNFSLPSDLTLARTGKSCV